MRTTKMTKILRGTGVWIMRLAQAIACGVAFYVVFSVGYSALYWLFATLGLPLTTLESVTEIVLLLFSMFSTIAIIVFAVRRERQT